MLSRSGPPRVARPRAFLTAVGAAAAAACGTDGPTTPGPSSFDVVQVLNSAGSSSAVALRSVGAAGVPGAWAASGVLVPTPAAVRNCAWNAGAQSFACAPATVNGLTLTYAYTPLDAEGRPQASPDAGTTAAVRVVSTTTGTSSPGGVGPLTVSQRQDATIRGLLAGPRVLDAVMTMSMQFDGGGPAAGRYQVTQTVVGLVLPEGGARWPTAGTVTSEVVGPPGGEPLRTVMTFNGTSTVTITTPGRPGRCTFDLAATTFTSETFRCTDQ